MTKQISEIRENLLTRIIHIYGFEHGMTISFAEWCEEWEENESNNKILESIVECHERWATLQEDDE